MSDARWFEVEADAADAAAHFAMAKELFDLGGFDRPGRDGYVARMAFMHAMQAGHTSLERALVRVLDMLGEDRPTGDSWHEDLIRRVSSATLGRTPILTGDIVEAADETRRFRHVAMRSYNRFSPTKARPAAESAAVLAGRIGAEFKRFRDAIDPPTASVPGPGDAT